MRARDSLSLCYITAGCGGGMSEQTSIIYTIARCDPRSVDGPEAKQADINIYLSLMDKLQADSAFKFKNILLGLARQLNQHVAVKAVDNSEVYVKIKSLFVGDSFDTIVDDRHMYLVERIKVGNDVVIEPLDVWTIDIRIFKAMLTKNLYLSGMNGVDRSLVERKYGLRKYASKVRLGEFDDAEAMEYVRKYNCYMAQFYKRSESPKREVLTEYLRKAKYGNALVCYNNMAINNKFEHEVSVVGTLDQVKYHIQDFADDMKFYAERMYQTCFAEDQYKSQRGGGNATSEVQFGMWNRYLRIYDLHKEYIDKNKKITDGVLNAICKKIQDEFNYYQDSEPREVRKKIKKEYNEALRLIKESTKGQLS